jgi:hypothetical protein
LSLIKRVTLQKIVAYDFQYDPHILQCCLAGDVITIPFRVPDWPSWLVTFPKLLQACVIEAMATSS